jgi:RNA 2',3'-cyclic 3'-phosphodiesterase
MPRLFVALPVPPAVRSRLASLQEDLGGAGLPVRWSRREGLHLTLVFIGERPVQDVSRAEGALRRAARERAPFALTLAGLGGFPGLARPRVLWAGVGGDREALNALQASVARELRAAGVPFESRPYRAHVTLGRTTGALDAAGVAALEAAARAASDTPWGAWPASEAHLMESRLQPGGAIYTALVRAPLGAPGGVEAAPRSERPRDAGPAVRREEALR